MKKEKFLIEGMSCHHCVMAVKKELTPLGLEEMKIDIGSADVKYDDSKIMPGQISAAIEEAGYKVVSVVSEQ